MSHHPTVEARDTTARTSLRLLAVLDVLSTFMQKSIEVRLVVVAVLAGFLGSVLSDITLPEHALAQSEPARQVTAQEFHVVDSEGRMLAVIGGASMRLGEEDANQALPFSEGRIQLFDSGGRIVWSAPQPLVHPAGGGGVERSGLQSAVSIPIK